MSQVRYDHLEKELGKRNTIIVELKKELGLRPYHPVAFEELCDRFMAEIRISSKRLEQLEKVISPLLARSHCECTDEEAQALLLKAINEAEKVIEDDFGGMKGMAGNFDTWLKYQRKTEKL